MVGALSSFSPATFLSLNTSIVLQASAAFITEPEVKTQKSISRVTAPATVFFPPDNGTKLNFAPVCSPSARIPIEAGCAKRLVPTFKVRFLPSETISSMVLNLLSAPTKTHPGSVSTLLK